MYLLDANIFITAKNQHYGFDFVPAFWEWLDQGHAAGILASVAKVFDEIDDGSDELTTWATARKPVFLEPDAATLRSYAQLSAWADSSLTYTQSAIQTFLANADYQLVAHAHAHGHTVVTHEKPRPNSKSRILIPDACSAMNVDWIGPWEMLRAESARFVLP